MPRIARWSIDNRRTVIVLWIAVLVTALGAARGIGNHVVNDLTLPHTDAERATTLLKSRFPAQAGDSDQIVLHARAGTLADARIRSVA